MKYIQRILTWFLSHPAWTGITAIATIAMFFIQWGNYENKLLVNHEPGILVCIKKPMHGNLKNKDINFTKSLRHLSKCYINGCYTYQLKISNFVESDISNQSLKGLDWYVVLSISNNRENSNVHSKSIEVRSNGMDFNEIRARNAFKLDEKVAVWLDSLAICKKEK